MNPLDPDDAFGLGGLTHSLNTAWQQFEQLKSQYLFNSTGDDDEGGTAGVREPVRPRPPVMPPMAMALSLP